MRLLKNKTMIILAAAICCILFFINPVNGQDNNKREVKTSHFFNNIFKRIRSAITVSKQDSTIKATVINTKSDIPFNEYSGKIIRSVKTEELGFEKIFTDTTKRLNYLGTRLLNALHTNTKAWVINDNLFIKKGTKLNPYMLADNERYLRSLGFIQDARIVVKPVEGSEDSVDVLVVTKDFFSITGGLDIGGINHQQLSAAESNLAGAGQKIQVTTLHDINRHPSFGYDFMYAKNSIAHSFVNGTIGFSRINTDRTGLNNVKTFYTTLSRNLVSPYSRVAGGLEVRVNESDNLFHQPDSLFRNYQNASIDGWMGYNVGVKKLLHNSKSRDRTFVAVRYINNNFSQAPYQFSKIYNSLFNSVHGVLGEVTFFKQEFYKTNYIYGFGTTEDVPYGYNVAITSGWYKQMSLSRPYFGINANRYIATEKGAFMQYFLRAGLFINRGKAEDVSVLAGGSIYSRLYLFNNFKMRQYIKYSYTRIFNRVVYDSLQINNSLGLSYFSADTLKGIQRMSVYAETFFFARYKLFGFQLAPFAFVDASLLTHNNSPFNKSDLYTGIGGGIRTRNVNLIFSTAELRLVYFPHKAQNGTNFKISFYGNIRFRYNTNYIRAPNIVQLNNDDSNSFY